MTQKRLCVLMAKLKIIETDRLWANDIYTAGKCEDIRRNDIVSSVSMKLKNMLYLILITLLLLVQACAPAKVSLMEYEILPDRDSKSVTHSLPDYVVQKRKPKIAVLPPSDTTQYRECQLSKSAWEYLVQTLANSGGVEITERSQLDAIMQELKFRTDIASDIDINSLVKIVKGVDFVFVGSVSKANTGAGFSGGSVLAPTCSEVAEVGLTFRLIEFPAGSVRKAFNMNGKSTINRQTFFLTCKVQDPCGLLNKAIYNAIDNAKEDLMNAFPVYGYIYKTMTNKKNPKERIAFITLGTSDGIRPGSKVEIIEFKKEKDPIKNTEILIAQVVGECTVSETDLQSDRSICIISEESVNKVFTGHAVKVKVSETFMRKLEKELRNL